MIRLFPCPSLFRSSLSEIVWAYASSSSCRTSCGCLRLQDGPASTASGNSSASQQLVQHSGHQVLEQDDVTEERRLLVRRLTSVKPHHMYVPLRSLVFWLPTEVQTCCCCCCCSGTGCCTGASCCCCVGAAPNGSDLVLEGSVDCFQRKGSNLSSGEDQWNCFAAWTMMYIPHPRPRRQPIR
jgi:hypothetical protein